MSTKLVARFSVSWGYDVTVDLLVSQKNWLKIVRGENITIRGSGYRYDGEFFWDYWDFLGGLDGELIVRYGSLKEGDYTGQGFIGKPREAIVDPI
jgi:hypothetical protein